jgi:hypothetical protein
VAHRANHSTSHRRVRDERVEAFCRDKSKSFCHIGSSHYLKPFVFKGHSHHVANGGVVIHEQYLAGEGELPLSRPCSLAAASYPTYRKLSSC